MKLTDTPYKREDILRRDEFKCRECGMENVEHREEYGVGLHIHHKERRSDGGGDERENLTTLCVQCHGRIERGMDDEPPAKADGGEKKWKTIRVPKDVYEDAKARKEEHGVTWGEYVNPHAWHSVFDGPKDVGDTAIDAGADLDTEALAAEIRAELDTDAPACDEIQRAVRTIEERTGRIEQTLEDMGARR